jgi:nucleoside-diphosphate-sugar epimerase
MRIAVTGGSGLVGRGIVRLLSDAHDIVNIDIAAPDTSGGGELSGRPEAPHVSASVLDLAGLCLALRGADAVVHAAGLPGPSFGAESEILETNVEGTRNVALAAAEEGVRRIVFLSSEAVLGFVFSEGRTRPRYLPIDEAHPLAPTEAYGRSKLMAEAALKRSTPGESTVVCLRPPWIWAPEEYEKLRGLTREPSRWWDGLWAYVHRDDLSRAVELAALADLPAGFYAAYVAAPDNGTRRPTRELVAEFYPGVPLDEGVEEFGSLVSSDRLESLLGFRPTMTWREFLDRDHRGDERQHAG